MYFKTLKMDIPFDSAILPLLGIYPKEIHSDLHKNTDTKLTTEFFFKQKNKQPKHLLVGN